MEGSLLVCQCGAKISVIADETRSEIRCKVCGRYIRVPNILADHSLLADLITLDRERPLSGQILGGKYKVEVRLGEGAMGEVYKGTDLVLSIPVAIKILKPPLEINQEKKRIREQRFLREVRIVLTLIHEGIVQARSIGKIKEGIYYMVMDFCPGRSLNKILEEKGRLSPHQSINIASQLLSALSFAHAKGVIHRDIKPSNIMIEIRGNVKTTSQSAQGLETTSNSDTFKVRLLDFGIAKSFLLKEAGLEETLTRPGAVIGSIRYMSPEQADGEKVDTRADIYAVGAILFHMLYGEPPYTGTMQEMLVHLLGKDSPPFEKLRRFHIPGELIAVLHRALAKKKESRFSSASEFLKALEDCGRPSLKGKLFSLRFCFSHKLAIILGFLLFMLLSLSLLYKFWFVPYLKSQSYMQEGKALLEKREINEAIAYLKTSFKIRPSQRTRHMLQYALLLQMRESMAKGDEEKSRQALEELLTFIEEPLLGNLLKGFIEEELILIRSQNACDKGEFDKAMEILMNKEKVPVPKTLSLQSDWIKRVRSRGE